MLVLLAAGTHRINVSLEGHLVEAEEPWDVGTLPDGNALRVFSLGFDRLIADLYWLRTVNYLGHEKVHAAGFPHVYKLGELVTDIDPTFKTAYSVMHSALTVLRPDYERAVTLLEKGVKHIDWWKLHFLLGYTLYADLGEYERAAKHIQRATELPGGPTYLPLLASRLLANAGDPDTAIAFVAARIQETAHEETKERLRQRLRDLVIQRDLGRLNAAIERYRAARGAPPGHLNELLVGGFASLLPRDPEGNPYRIEDGKAITDLEHDTLEVHRRVKTKE